MANKTERVIEYIARLEPGEKVSVRGLSQALGVSEGTAYKSIKAAEAQGLVLTRPKAGTLRINIRSMAENGGSTLAEAARSIGALCLCGAESAVGQPLPMLVLADGSEEQFRSVVRRSGSAVLCVVGDRPELQRAAVELGIDILLTGGAIMDPALLGEAERAGLVVFSSEQDSSILMGMLIRRFPEQLPQREMSQVRDWMQLPRYLYHDDMVSEWHRMYTDIFYDSSSCAVVDDSLRVCGTVEAMTAMNAPPGLRLSELMDRPGEDAIVDEELEMEELAERLLKSRRLFAAVNSPDGMSGFIGLSDVLRYYRYKRTYRDFTDTEESALQLSSDDPEERRRIYTVWLKPQQEEANRSGAVSVFFAAAAWHAYDVLGRAVRFENGTFYAPLHVSEPGEYMVSCEIMKQDGNGLIFELELFDDSSSYLKGTLSVSAEPEPAEQRD